MKTQLDWQLKNEKPPLPLCVYKSRKRVFEQKKERDGEGSIKCVCAVIFFMCELVFKYQKGRDLKEGCGVKRRGEENLDLDQTRFSLLLLL